MLFLSCFFPLSYSNDLCFVENKIIVISILMQILFFPTRLFSNALLNKDVSPMLMAAYGFHVMTLTAISAAFTTAGMGSLVLSRICKHRK
jgi:hypothetical protein